MREDQTSNPNQSGEWTRRNFLTRGSAATFGAALGWGMWTAEPPLEWARTLTDATNAAGNQTADQNASSTEPTTDRDVVRPAPGMAVDADGVPIVVNVWSSEVLREQRVDQRVARDMIEAGVRLLTGADDIRKAWRALVHPSETVAVKFNSAGGPIIGTTRGVAGALVESLADAGFDRSRLMLIEVPNADARELGTSTPPSGWTDQEYDFGSGRDRLAAWVMQADAIINVPFVKTHNIAGFTCGLKNLSHAAVKHPGRYHTNGCSPYVYDIWRLEPIQQRLRLTLADALRPAVKNGPHPGSGDLFDTGEMFFALDGVAIDAAALAWLNLRRFEVGLTSVEESFGAIGYLADSGGNTKIRRPGVHYRVRRHRV